MVTLNQLLLLLPNLSASDRALIQDAYYFAEEAHRPQKRKSGEPYFVHVSAVAKILAELGLDTPTIVAGLLHDVVEDTQIRYADIQARYGSEVRQLVDGVTKIEELTPEEGGYELSEAEYLRKTIFAMTDDVRVILIKLADRLHNMQTLGSLSSQRQREISQETLDLFTPLASRLGIWVIKSELETLCFQYLEPEAYASLKAKVDESDRQLAPFFEEIICDLQNELARHGIQAIIKRHLRNFYTIHQEMKSKHISFEETFGVRSIRIMVDSITQCYQTMGLVHQIWRPIVGKMQDYIAAPKDNFYQSLHTAVYREDGGALKVQIRTHEMDDQALYGIASYWRLKEQTPDLTEKLAKRLAYLRDLIEPAENEGNPEAFLKSVIENIDNSRIYVQTPRGDIIDLPRHSTPIDFAYHIHTQVGHHCRGARVNGHLVSLDHDLQNGDQVEIYTTLRGEPLLEWLDPRLGYVKTNRARSKIKAWFKAQKREELVEAGRAALDKTLSRFGLPQGDYQIFLPELAEKQEHDLLEQIGLGNVTPSELVTRALDQRLAPTLQAIAKPALPIIGAAGYTVKLARCCKPQMGDEIIGYITREAKVSVHRADCSLINQRHDIIDRLIPVNWGPKIKQQVFPAPIELRTLDRAGIMGEIGFVISNENINMSEVYIQTSNGFANFSITMQIDSFASLSRVLNKIQAVEGVLEARRVPSS